MIFFTVISSKFCKKSRSSYQRCSVQKAVLKNFTIFTGIHLCRSLFLIKLQVFRPATLLKETPTQVFFCEYCEIFKSTYFEKHLRTTAFVNSRATVFQEILALPKRNALNYGIFNLGELVQRTQIQNGSRRFYLPYFPKKFSKFRTGNTCCVFSKKSTEFLFFLILFSAGITQSLVETFLEQKYFFSHNCSN